MASIQSILNKIASMANRTGLFSIQKGEFFDTLTDMTNKISEVNDNVNSVAKSLIFQDTVISIVTTLPSSGLTVGQRYILSTDNKIYTATSTTAFGTGVMPTQGWAAMVTSLGYIYSYNGGGWKDTGLKAFPVDVAIKTDVGNSMDVLDFNDTFNILDGKYICDSNGKILAKFTSDGFDTYKLGANLTGIVTTAISVAIEPKAEKTYVDSNILANELDKSLNSTDDGKFITDENGNILAKFTSEGFDAYKLGANIKNSLGGKLAEYDVVFASFDSSNSDKSKADFVCTVDNAQTTIQTAIDAAMANSTVNSIKALFLNGTYYMTHFIVPTGDDVNGSPYCIKMPRGIHLNNVVSPNKYPTVCEFHGVNKAMNNTLNTARFILRSDAYLLNPDNSHSVLTDFKTDSQIYQSAGDFPDRYLIDNKRYSVIRCLTTIATAQNINWCSYLMDVEKISLICEGSDNNRTLANLPIIMIDGYWAATVTIKCVRIGVETGLFDTSHVVFPNCGFSAIRGTVGQSWGWHCRIESSIIVGYYTAIELGGEHWLLQDVVMIQNHIGISVGTYHDSYGSGHVNTLVGCAIERCYYPMYWFYNGSGWMPGGTWDIVGLSLEQWLVSTSGEKTVGCVLEAWQSNPKGRISLQGLPTAQFFSSLYLSKFGASNLKIENLVINNASQWFEVNPSLGFKAEHGQRIWINDKAKWATWNNYNGSGAWEDYAGAVIAD